MYDEYSTSDFPDAITLATRKHVLIRIDRTLNSSRAFFVFENTEKLQSDLEKIQRGQVKVFPLDFWNAQKRLKQKLYDGQ